MKHDSTYDDEVYSRTTFGFWLYLLTDFVLFGTFFATYAVLHGSVFGGPGARDLLHLPFITWQTIIMLLSAFTAGLGSAAAHRRDKRLTICFFMATFVVGCVFLAMMSADLSRVLSAGHTWKNSAFLSMYFSMLSLYGLHLLFALAWTVILLFPVWKEGVNAMSLRRIACLKMFWQFLNIIWIFIYSFLSI